MYNNFHTFSEYMKMDQRDQRRLTPSMEDYVEMIYRLSVYNGYTRLLELSTALNVQPPSATKMVQRLGEQELIEYERYGVIILTEKGKIIGEMLLKRHNTIEGLLKVLGVTESYILEETEKIEHTISIETMECIQDFIDFISLNPSIIKAYNKYRNDLYSAL